MAKGNTRLELTWIGKENRPKLERRAAILMFPDLLNIVEGRSVF